MRAAGRAAAARSTSNKKLRLRTANSSTAGEVISPGKFEVENPALLELDLWTEIGETFNPSYQLSCINSEYMQVVHDEEVMAGLTEQLRVLIQGTKLAEC
jgi:hypothetical protein